MQLMALKHGFTSLQTSSSKLEMNVISVPLQVNFVDSTPNYIMLYAAIDVLTPGSLSCIESCPGKS